MTDTAPSDRQQLVQAQFDRKELGDVPAWIQTRRQAGRSWAAIAYEIHDLVGMTVSYETLRRWLPNDRPRAAEGEGNADE